MKVPSHVAGASKISLLCFESFRSDNDDEDHHHPDLVGEKTPAESAPATTTTTTGKGRKTKSLVKRPLKSSRCPRYLRGIPAVSKRDKQWNIMFKRLQDFRHQYGHCNVPQGYTLDPELATWVKNQRQAYRYMLDKKTTKRISPDRVTRLNHVGFEWRKYVRSVAWKPPKRMQPALAIPQGLFCNERL